MKQYLTMRDTFIGLRVKPKEKQEIRKIAIKRDFRTISSFIFWLIAQAKKGLILFLFFIVGCASVSYLPANQYQSFPSTQSVQILYENPQKSYIEIGTIIAEGEYLSSLNNKLKNKAMKIGADAVIIKSTSAREEASFSWFGSLQRIEGLAIKWKE